jgi:hypothetical protein
MKEMHWHAPDGERYLVRLSAGRILFVREGWVGSVLSSRASLLEVHAAAQVEALRQAKEDDAAGDVLDLLGS